MVSAAFSVTCARTHTHTIEAHTADNRRTLGSKIIITPWRSQRSLCIRREGMPLSNRESTLSLSITKDLTEYRIFGITKHHNDEKKKKWGWGWGGRILGSMWRMQNYARTYQRYLIIIIIIYPLTTRVVGAPQMISQPVSSTFPCSPLPSGTWRTLGLSLLWCCLPTSSSICLVFFPLSLCLAGWFWPDMMNGRQHYTTKSKVPKAWKEGTFDFGLSPEGSSLGWGKERDGGMFWTKRHITLGLHEVLKELLAFSTQFSSVQFRSLSDPVVEETWETI